MSKIYITEITAITKTGERVLIEGPVIMAESFEQAEMLAPEWVTVVGEFVEDVFTEFEKLNKELIKELENEISDHFQQRHEIFYPNEILNFN